MTKLTIRSVTGLKLWCHGAQMFLPAEFTDVEVEPWKAEFLAGYSHCEIATAKPKAAPLPPAPPPLPGLPKRSAAKKRKRKPKAD